MSIFFDIQYQESLSTEQISTIEKRLAVRTTERLFVYFRIYSQVLTESQQRDFCKKNSYLVGCLNVMATLSSRELLIMKEIWLNLEREQTKKNYKAAAEVIGIIQLSQQLDSNQFIGALRTHLPNYVSFINFLNSNQCSQELLNNFYECFYVYEHGAGDSLPLNIEFLNYDLFCNVIESRDVEMIKSFGEHFGGHFKKWTDLFFNKKTLFNRLQLQNISNLFYHLTDGKISPENFFSSILNYRNLQLTPIQVATIQSSFAVECANIQLAPEIGSATRVRKKTSFLDSRTLRTPGRKKRQSTAVDEAQIDGVAAATVTPISSAASVSAVNGVKPTSNTTTGSSDDEDQSLGLQRARRGKRSRVLNSESSSEDMNLHDFMLFRNRNPKNSRTIESSSSSLEANFDVPVAAPQPVVIDLTHVDDDISVIDLTRS